MKKVLTDCVRFANFATAQELDPRDLAKLLDMAHKAFSSGVREANTGTSANPARDRFEAAALALGYKTEWPGLWPQLRNGTGPVDLPGI